MNTRTYDEPTVVDYITRPLPKMVGEAWFDLDTFVAISKMISLDPEQVRFLVSAIQTLCDNEEDRDVLKVAHSLRQNMRYSRLRP